VVAEPVARLLAVEEVAAMVDSCRGAGVVPQQKVQVGKAWEEGWEEGAVVVSEV